MVLILGFAVLGFGFWGFGSGFGHEVCGLGFTEFRFQGDMRMGLMLASGEGIYTYRVP